MLFRFYEIDSNLGTFFYNLVYSEIQILKFGLSQ